MAQPETQKEQEVRILLEAQLQPEELLLAYTSGKSHTHYHIGLTAERLLLLPVKGKQSPPKAITIRREHIKSMKWSRLTGALMVKFNKDELQFKHTGVWKKRAKALIETYNQTTAPLEGKLNLTTPERLQQVQDFRRLELLNTAQETLDQAIQLDPSLVTDPAVARVQQRLFEQGLALQVGAAFSL